MTAGCFVHALWGDSRISIYPQLLDEVKWFLSQPYQATPVLWYVYGEENQRFLQALGIEPVLLSKNGFDAFGKSERPENPDVDNIIRHGSSMWRMKYPAIRKALEVYPACIWTDLDTVLSEPCPAGLWDRLAAGACFQCTIQQNHNRRAWWRGEDNEPRKTPGGNWMYFRGLDPIDRVLRLYAEHPGEWDLTVLARLTDELMGGTFLGSEKYKELGYEPYCHSLGKYEKRQIHRPPEQRIFITQWRKLGIRKMRGRMAA